MSSFVATLTLVGGAQHEEEASHAGLVNHMLAAAASRAPDGRRVVSDGACCLGHGLFATLPEDASGAQPLRFARDRAVVVSADARIDNRGELAPLLELSPAAPDAEFIAAAYLRWGEACAEHLIGDFAFVVWDPARSTLYCARDPVGVRPLYYTQQPAFFSCASEKRALLADARIDQSVDETAVALFLGEAFHERDRTLFRAIRALEPGHALIVTPGATTKRRLWRPDPYRRIQRPTDAAYAEEFRSILDEAVRARLRSRVPIAGHFSGGFDSTSVVAAATRLRQREGAAEVMPYRLSFPELHYDETGYAVAAADHVGIVARQLYPLDDVAYHRPRVERVTSDWLYMIGNLGIELVARRAREREGAGVMLTGFGGDQLLRPTADEPLHHLAAARLGRAADEVGGFAALGGYAARRAVWRALPTRAAAALYMSRRAGGYWASVAPELRSAFLDQQVEAAARSAAFEGPDAVQRDLASELVDSHNVTWTLTLCDKSGSHLGVEHRHPFLDRRVLEYLLGVPHHLRYDGRRSKGIVRLAMSADLPPVLLRRNDRMTFGDYHVRAVFEPFRGVVQQLLSHGELVRRGYVGERLFRRWLSRDLGRRHYRYAMMALALELLLRHLAQ